MKRFNKYVWNPWWNGKKTSEANWQRPRAWNAFLEEWLVCTVCGSWFQSRRFMARCPVAECTGTLGKPTERVLVRNKSNVFGEGMEAERIEFFRLVRDTPFLTWVVQTDTPDRIDRATEFAVTGRFPLNLWPAVHVHSQWEVQDLVPYLVLTEYTNRVVIINPVGPIDLTYWLIKRTATGQPAISLVVAAGQDRIDSRPVHPGWITALRDQCLFAGVPFFFEGWGNWVQTEPTQDEDGIIWVDEFGYVSDSPTGRDNEVCMVRKTSKKAGYLLEGKEWTPN